MDYFWETGRFFQLVAVAVKYSAHFQRWGRISGQDAAPPRRTRIGRNCGGSNILQCTRGLPYLPLGGKETRRTFRMRYRVALPLLVAIPALALLQQAATAADHSGQV